MKIAKIEDQKIFRVATVPAEIARDLPAVYDGPVYFFFYKNGHTYHYILCDSYISIKDVLELKKPAHCDDLTVQNEMINIWKDSLKSPFTCLRRFL